MKTKQTINIKTLKTNRQSTTTMNN